MGITMHYRGKLDDKIHSISSRLASPEMSDLSNLTATEIADRIERMLRDERDEAYCDWKSS